MRCLKKSYRRVQQLRRSRSRDDDERAGRSEALKQTHREYLALGGSLLLRARITRSGRSLVHALVEIQLDACIAHGERQLDQILGRVLHGEHILHEEKVFSIFDMHSEWIGKGKAGVIVEPELRGAVSEHHYGPILDHRVMQGRTDDEIAVPLADALAERYPAPHFPRTTSNTAPRLLLAVRPRSCNSYGSRRQ